MITDTKTKNKQSAPKQTNNSDPAKQKVHFEFTHPGARKVSIAGTFNEWNSEVTDMIAMGNGKWAKDLTLAPGTYEYLLVVDSNWIPDPKSNAAVTNPFGGKNSLLTVPPQQQAEAGRQKSAGR